MRVAALVLAAAATAIAQTPAKVPGAISGVITDDVTHKPIAGAVVALNGYGTSQITDALGRFVFDDVATPASYTVFARKPGYPDACFGEVSIAPSGLCRGRNIVLAEGQWFSTADIALTQLSTISGIVTDESGEPIVGAFVQALPETLAGGRRLIVNGPTVTTNDLGEYRLFGLRPGRYYVALPSVQSSLPASTWVENTSIEIGDDKLIVGAYVTPPAPIDGHPRAFPLTLYPGATSLNDAMAIVVRPGENKAGIDLRWQPVAASTVTGRVDGLPAGKRVSLRLVPVGMESLSLDAATSTTRPDGTFSFANVPIGSYTLDARQSSFQLKERPDIFPGTVSNMPAIPGAPNGLTSTLIVNGRTQLVMRPDPPGVSVYGRAAVSVGPAGASNVVVTLAPTLTISGRVVMEDVPEYMRSRSPRVVVEPVAADWHNSMRISDPPQGTGDMSFVIRGVMPGAYDLSVQVLGAAVVKSVRIDGLEHATTPFDVTSTNIDNVVVTLSGKLPTLSGAVRDGDGRPSDRALVVAFPSDRTMWPRLGLMPERAKVESTATNGTFALSNLPAGEFFVVAIDANDADRWPTPALLEQLAPFATRVSLTWGDTQTVDLKVTVIK